MVDSSAVLKALEAGDSLPSLSVVAVRLVELAADDACSAKDLARLIEKDPTLAVRLLRLGNSAFFRGSQPVSTLEGAIVKIGFHRLRIMALSFSLRETFPMGKVGSLDYERFWRSSLYQALLAKSLAQRLRTCNPEEAFVAGLTLEIGLLVLFDILIKGKNGEIPEDPNSLERTLSMEREQYGIDHRQVGEAALRFWKFPEGIVTCQMSSGIAAKGKPISPLAGVCDLACRFMRILFQGVGDFSALFREGDRYADLDSEVINEILLSTFLEVEEIARSLKLELDREKDLVRIMERANSALSRISEKVSESKHSDSSRLPSFENLDREGGSVDQTLQAVAHEIRNPLLAVGGFAKRLASVLDPSSDSGKYAHVILQEAMRLEQALARITSTKSS
jgi:HD-like signal output (HDOD) protein